MKADTILRYNADEVSVKELSQLIDEGKELNVVKLHATIKSQQETIEKLKDVIKRAKEGLTSDMAYSKKQIFDILQSLNK